MVNKMVKGLMASVLIVAIALIFTGCAAQLMGQLDADKAKLAELAKVRNDYCPEGDRLFAKAEALLDQATHEIVDEGNQKAHAADLLAKAEAKMAEAEKAYAECKPPKRYHAPKAAFSMPDAGELGEDVAMDGSASSDEDNDPLTYAWDFGDGSQGSGQMVKHVYAREGTYKVTLKVSDILYDSEPVSKDIVIKMSKPEIIKLKEINYENVHFGFDSSALTPDAIKILNENIVAINEHPDYNIVLIGHTDSTGPEDYNLGLSKRRAESVKKYLVEKGISAGKISVIGKGESEPKESNDTRANRMKNRRVETELHLIR